MNTLQKATPVQDRESRKWPAKTSYWTMTPAPLAAAKQQTRTPPSNQWAREEEEEQDEFGLLTQYIGQLWGLVEMDGNRQGDTIIQREIPRQTSLKLPRGPIQSDLQRDNTRKTQDHYPTFVSKWETAIRECKQKLAMIIINHLRDTAPI